MRWRAREAWRGIYSGVFGIGSVFGLAVIVFAIRVFGLPVMQWPDNPTDGLFWTATSIAIAATLIFAFRFLFLIPYQQWRIGYFKKIDDEWSPFLFHFVGHRPDVVHVTDEAGHDGGYVVVKFLIINGGEDRIDDLQVTIQGRTIYQGSKIPNIPKPIEPTTLRPRSGNTSISGGGQEEFVLLSRNASDKNVIFWGDHRLLDPLDRKRVEVDGQHYLNLRVHASNANSKLFLIGMITTGTEPVMIPISNDAELWAIKV